MKLIPSIITFFFVNACSTTDQKTSIDLSIENPDYQTRRAAFKFYDASKGCPSYNDLPGSKDYLGSIRANTNSVTYKLQAQTPIHVLYFRPKDTPGISAKGGATEIQKRSAEITILGPGASLTYFKNKQGKPAWRTSGEITIADAKNCKNREK